MIQIINNHRNEGINTADFAGEYHLGDNCIVFENLTASIGDLMVVH
jgi:hypothetical protein